MSAMPMRSQVNSSWTSLAYSSMPMQTHACSPMPLHLHGDMLFLDKHILFLLLEQRRTTLVNLLVTNEQV
jgi:hypothetical protein